MVSYSALVLILVLIAVLTLLGVNSAAFAQETTERYLSARIEIWSLFYRLMVVAFVIGAVVMGTTTYVIWRFRESHPKNREDITPAAGGGAHH
ncbi:MAG: heme transporter CcmC [Thermoproteota archaeon]|jgi:heme/copper-type cytochrome/quinol oxidase subunit 2|nr:heme transporter CcmC [Thermoproteota archaeon]